MADFLDEIEDEQADDFLMDDDESAAVIVSLKFRLGYTSILKWWPTKGNPCCV